MVDCQRSLGGLLPQERQRSRRLQSASKLLSREVRGLDKHFTRRIFARQGCDAERLASQGLHKSNNATKHEAHSASKRQSELLKAHTVSVNRTVGIYTHAPSAHSPLSRADTEFETEKCTEAPSQSQSFILQVRQAAPIAVENRPPPTKQCTSPRSPKTARPAANLRNTAWRAVLLTLAVDAAHMKMHLVGQARSRIERSFVHVSRRACHVCSSTTTLMFTPRFISFLKAVGTTT